MPSIDENILKEEELIGGFEPGSTEDESFYLEKIEEYPGNLPYEFPIDIPPPEEIPEDNSTNLTGNPDDLQYETVDTGNSENDIPLGDEKIDLSQNINPEPANVVAREEIPVSSTETEINSESADEEATIQADLDLLSLDLKKLIDDDQSRFQRKRKSTDYFNPEDKKEIQIKEFVPIKDDEAQKFDITLMDADHPSTYGIKLNLPPLESEENISVDKIELPVEKESDEYKKRRRVAFWKHISISTAAMFLLIIIGCISYYYYYKIDPFKPKPVTAQKEETKDSVHSKVEKETNRIAIDSTTKPKDTLSAKTIETPDTNLTKPKDAETKIPEEENKDFSKNEVKTEIIPKPKNAEIITKKKPLVKNYKNRYKHIAINAVPKKSKKLKNTHFDNKSENLTSTIVNVQCLYVVEVYSSPLKEDANDWINKLKKKNVANAYISQQKIRDKIWYKVRFGNFKTFEEASSTAIKLGFVRAWIDRIR